MAASPKVELDGGTSFTYFQEEDGTFSLNLSLSSTADDEEDEPMVRSFSDGTTDLSKLSVKAEHFKNIFPKDEFGVAFTEMMNDYTNDKGNVQITTRSSTLSAGDEQTDSNSSGNLQFKTKMFGVWCEFEVPIPNSAGKIKKDKSGRSTYGSNEKVPGPSARERENPRDHGSKEKVRRAKYNPTAAAKEEEELKRQRPRGAYNEFDPKKQPKQLKGEEKAPGLNRVGSTATDKKKSRDDGEPYGFRDVGAREASKLLKPLKPGTYLVRYSGQAEKGTAYVITYYNNLRKIRHHRVEKTSQGWAQAKEGGKKGIPKKGGKKSVPKESGGGALTIQEYIDDYMHDFGALYPVQDHITM